MKRDLDLVRSDLVSEKTEHELRAAIAAAKLEKLDLESENEFLRRRNEALAAKLARRKALERIGGAQGAFFMTGGAAHGLRTGP